MWEKNLVSVCGVDMVIELNYIGCPTRTLLDGHLSHVDFRKKKFFFCSVFELEIDFDVFGGKGWMWNINQLATKYCNHRSYSG